ncbi:MAG: hypothetical protein QOD30_1768, partial [Actinomycetota bacterium]|nr:hypothetical protein [Actinomycetota bacterium]
MTPSTPTRTEQLTSLAATLRRVRWFCVAFGAVQFAVYEGPPGLQVPHTVKPWGVAVCAWLVVTNVVSALGSRRDDVDGLERTAAIEIAMDAALILFVIGLLAFDPYGTEWGLLCVVALEGALRLDARGSAACWLATSAAYIGVQVWAHSTYGIYDRWTLLTFRLGIVLVVAFIAGGLATQLRRHLESSRRAREEAHERARLLR